MHVPYNYLPRQFADVEEIIAGWRELISSSEYTLGPYIDEFESSFSVFAGVSNCISTNCGTDALILSLRAIGVGDGDEVITPCNSFYASAGAIAAVGATPVFCDVDDRYQLDIQSLKSAISGDTRALLPVHWAGASPDMRALEEVAVAHDLLMAEDACMGIGGSVFGQSPGSFGSVGAFSMHPLKTLNAIGDGGMVVTDDDSLSEWMSRYRNHGMVNRDEIAFWGVNMRLQPLQAVVALHMLASLSRRLNQRLRNQRRLDEALGGLPGVILPRRESWNSETVSLYMVRVANRDVVIDELVASGIDAKIHYPVPLHLQRPGQALGYARGDFPMAERQASELITLPAHEYLTESELDYMIATFVKIVLTVNQ